ncbi:MAG TPA: DUF4349 domain-containing protein [Caulobacter sp.]|nr:DUF4349 domain-containing protein [Caulobacter sp.]
MRRVLVSASALALLTACGPDQEAPADTPIASAQGPRADGAGALGVVDQRASSTPPAIARLAPAPGGAAADVALSQPASGGGVMPIVAPSLAYEYAYALELPAGSARGQLTAHQGACEAAGAAVCQVISAESLAVGAKEARGSLVLRATAEWLRQFRGRLEQDAGAAGGKVLSVTTRTEDLTRSMIDTEAAIRSQEILQARMERILSDRTGDLDQAIAIEQQIARVRAGIDAMRSSLEVMRARTAMQKLTIEYSVAGAKPAPTIRPEPAPIRAFKRAISNLGDLLALFIFLGVHLIPLGLLAAVGWGLLKRFRKPRPFRQPPASDGREPPAVI